MVVPLGPGKFYGSSLPRPRFYSNVTFNSERVDPPVSVMDPFLSWANEAHWSMGGLNTERVRFQGRIEGNADRLRKFRESQAKLQTGNTPRKSVTDPAEKNKKRAGSVSPPPAPKANKKRKFMDLFDDGEEEEEEVKVVGKDKSQAKRWPVRKLVGEFERVAKESESELVGVRTRRNGVYSVVEESNKKGSDGKKAKKRLRKVGGNPSGVRTSPRLAKQ